jgi:hypothetical protein
MCSGGVISHLRSPLGGHAGEREGGGRRPEEAGAPGGVGGHLGEEGLTELLWSLLSWTPLYIGGGGGCTLPLHQDSLGQRRRGGEGRRRLGRVGPSRPPKP